MFDGVRRLHKARRDDRKKTPLRRAPGDGARTKTHPLGGIDGYFENVGGVVLYASP